MRKQIPTNYQDLFKFIAIIAMIIDHLGWFFWDNTWLRLIGRVAMPIFCFFAGYNYYLAKQREAFRFFWQRKRYLNILTIGILIDVLINLSIPERVVSNILITIIISLFLIDIFEKIKMPYWMVQILSILLLVPTYYIFDYGTLGFAFVYIGYNYKIVEQREIYILLTTLWLNIFWFMSYITLSLSTIQNLTMIGIITFQFWIFNFADLQRLIKYRILLLSRHILTIYFAHITLFILLRSAIY